MPIGPRLANGAFKSKLNRYYTSKIKRRSRRISKKASVALIKDVIRREAEHKEVLTNVSNVANATNAFVTLVNGIAQGTTELTRVGKAVTHQYIEVSVGIFSALSATALATNSMGDFGFWALVLDRQPNGAAAAFTDVFDNSAGSTYEGTDFRITTTNQDRFKILKREEWTVGNSFYASAVDPVCTGAPPYHDKFYVNLSMLGKSDPLDQKVNFSGTGATIASISSGAIYFIWASSNSTATLNTTLGGQVKYRFVDT